MSGLLKSVPAVALFGYAVAANLALWTGGADAFRPSLTGSILRSGAGPAIDALYAEALPHRIPAMGALGAARYVLLGEGRLGVTPGRDGYLFSDEEFQPVTESAMDAALLRIEEAHSILYERGVSLVVVALPAKLDIDRAMAPETEGPSRAAELQSAFLARLAETGIPAVDARPALASVNAPFFRTDTHWTPAGAEAVAAAIRASGFVPTGDRPHTREPLAPETFTGDLVGFVASADWAPRIGLGPERVTPWRAVAASRTSEPLDLFGGPSVTALDLVGTSYSANARWGFVAALEIALSRDVYNHAKAGIGPWRPMADYLETGEHAGVVLWEIPVRYLSDPDLWTSEAET